MFRMLMLSLLLVTGMFAGDNCKAVYGNGNNVFKLATGSPGELGLLKVLIMHWLNQQMAQNHKNSE